MDLKCLYFDISWLNSPGTVVCSKVKEYQSGAKGVSCPILKDQMFVSQIPTNKKIGSQIPSNNNKDFIAPIFLKLNFSFPNSQEMINREYVNANPFPPPPNENTKPLASSWWKIYLPPLSRITSSAQAILWNVCNV